MEFLGILATFLLALRLQIFEYDHICMMVLCKSDDLPGYLDRQIVIDPSCIIPQPDDGFGTMLTLFLPGAVQHTPETVFFSWEVDEFPCNDSSV